MRIAIIRNPKFRFERNVSYQLKILVKCYRSYLSELAERLIDHLIKRKSGFILMLLQNIRPSQRYQLLKSRETYDLKPKNCV